jgi:hypothetical protein
MHHRIALMSLAATALVIGACTDQVGGTRMSTEPGDATPAVRYVSTSTAAIVNPKTHRLETVVAPGAPSGVNASIVGSASTTGFQVYPYEPGIAPVAGHTSFSFTDSAKHVHKIVLLYRTGGGPPAAMQHYVDGMLGSTTAYSWWKSTQGWLRTRSYMQSVRNGVLVGTYTRLTPLPKTTLNPGPVQPVRYDRPSPVTPFQRTLGTVAYALAFAFAPQDATAQFYFYDCRQEWLRYGAAAAVLAGASAGIVAAPELSPALATAFIAALATTAAMEDLLIDCMIAHDSVSLGGFGSGGFGTGSGSGSGSGGDDSCMAGSYAPQCTTPFTL